MDPKHIKTSNPLPTLTQRDKTSLTGRFTRLLTLLRKENKQQDWECPNTRGILESPNFSIYLNLTGGWNGIPLQYRATLLDHRNGGQVAAFGNTRACAIRRLGRFMNIPGLANSF